MVLETCNKRTNYSYLVITKQTIYLMINLIYSLLFVHQIKYIYKSTSCIFSSYQHKINGRNHETK